MPRISSADKNHVGQARLAHEPLNFYSAVSSFLGLMLNDDEARDPV